MEKVYLDADKREVKGKGPAKSLRRKGLIPSVLYGEGKNELLNISSVALTRLLQAHSAVITLKIHDGKKIREANVLIKEIQRSPVTTNIIHVDFNEISLTKTIEVNVPIVSKGEPAGVKLEGGTLEHLLWELKIQCLPTQIPANIEVDVSGMKIGDSIVVKDIKIPEGIKLLHDAEQIVFSLKPPTEEKPAEEVAAAEAEAPAEPEVLKQKSEEQLAREAEEKERKKKEQEQG